MTIKVKLRGDKAIVRLHNQMEEQYFIHVIRSARDNGSPHPPISLKNRDNCEVPVLKPPKNMLPKVIKDSKAVVNIDKNIKVG